MQKTISLISLKNIRYNAHLIKSRLSGQKFFAVVKADAYGHGAIAVSHEIDDVVDGFCVAIIDEGVALRVSGITKPILVFCPPLSQDDFIRARFYDLSITVIDVATAEAASGLDCHIKVNTGMNRSGCNPNSLSSVIDSLKGRFVGTYSHLYAPENRIDTLRQEKIFSEAAKLSKSKNPQVICHLLASGGLLNGIKFDAVRVGIMLYGYVPAGFENIGLLPAMKIYARRQQTTVYIGGGVGYQRSNKEYGTLSTYRLGYADGFKRGAALGEGNLCMDAFISEVGKDLLLVMDNADVYAAKCGTISYEVLTSMTKRSEKIYER